MRAATADELTLLRTPGQMVELHLLTITPAVIFTARINQSFDTTDSVVQLIYDGGSGTLADVLTGMTMYIGSTPGGYDKGMVRIRKTPTATRFYIGLTSDIVFEDNDYLTVVDAFDLWQRDPTVTASTTYIDTDVPYSTQHTLREPVVGMGPMVEVLEYSGAPVTSARAAEALTCLGVTVTAYAWSAPGASAISDMDTATPAITYDTPGTYRVSCTFTAETVSFTEFRWCVVVDAANPPTSKFILSKCSGELDSGYWTSEVIMYANADLSTIRDRALAVVYAKDWYGSIRQSIGPVAGFENIILEGWIAGESISRKWRDNSVSFRIDGPGAWLDKKSIPATILNNTPGAPTAWDRMTNLTVDKALWHLLHFRTTATRIMDIHLTGDTRFAPAMEGPAGTIWQQLQAMSEKIKASPACNRYGQLYVEIDTQMLALADRSTIPVVQTLTPADWQEGVDYDRITESPTSMVELSGYMYDGITITELKSRAPGNSYGRSGTPDSEDDLLFSSQTQANFLSGAIYAKNNNEFPYIPVKFAGNHRLWDICPRSLALDVIDAADTMRGISITQNLIPRSVSFSFEDETTSLVTEVDFEAETTPRSGVTVIVEKEADNTGDMSDIDTDFADLPSVDLPTTDLPDWMADSGDLPGLVCRITDGYEGNGPFQLYVGNSAIVSGFYTSGLLASWVRKASATHQTYALLDAYFEVADSTSGPWAPQTDDTIPCEIVPNNGLLADLPAEYISYSWDLRPSQNGGHGILRATFSPPSGFNASYYYIKVSTSGRFSEDSLLIDTSHYIKNFTGDMSLSQFLLFGRVGVLWPSWLSGSAYGYRDAIFKVTFLKAMVGQLRLTEELQEYYSGTGDEYSAHRVHPMNDPSGITPISPDTTYSPYLATSDYVGGTGEVSFSAVNNPITRTSGYWTVSIPGASPTSPVEAYFLVRENDSGIGSGCNQHNGIRWELKNLIYRPAGTSGEADETVFGTAARRVQVISFNVYNVCAKE